MRTRHRVAIALIVIAIAATSLVLLTTVGDDEPGRRAPEAPSGAPEPTTAPPARAPLTGRLVDDRSELDHPAVAIKVSDVRQAHPQVGVDRADIVFVEPIGVAYTRLAAVFHSDLPDSVGPVRSVRPADAPLLGPMSPVFGNTMAAGWILDYTNGVADWDALGTLRVKGTDAYTIDGTRPQPDHVIAHPRELLKLSEFTEPPPPYFSYAPNADASSAARHGEPGSSVVITYGGDWQVRWTFDDESGRYLRQEPWGRHVVTNGRQVAATNVLIVQVDSVVDKLVDGHGAPVPVLQLVDGSGRFTALSGGSSITGTWTKGDVNEPFQLQTDAGTKLQLAPGNTWVELPTDEAVIAPTVQH